MPAADRRFPSCPPATLHGNQQGEWEWVEARVREQQQLVRHQAQEAAAVLSITIIYKRNTEAHHSILFPAVLLLFRSSGLPSSLLCPSRSPSLPSCCCPSLSARLSPPLPLPAPSPLALSDKHRQQQSSTQSRHAHSSKHGTKEGRRKGSCCTRQRWTVARVQHERRRPGESERLPGVARQGEARREAACILQAG